MDNAHFGNNKILIASWALIVNEKGEILLHKRKNTGSYDGFWANPGGRLERGEKLFEGAKREALEEVGVEIEIIDFLEFFEDVKTDDHGIYFCFLAKIAGGEPRNLEPEKCEEVSWFSPDDLPKNISPFTQKYLSAYFKKLGDIKFQPNNNHNKN